MERTAEFRHPYQRTISDIQGIARRLMLLEILRSKEVIPPDDFEEARRSAVSDRDSVLAQLAYDIVSGPSCRHMQAAELVCARYELNSGVLGNALAITFMNSTGITDHIIGARDLPGVHLDDVKGDVEFERFHFEKTYLRQPTQFLNYN
jgi:hypothetical protein